ncbi:MAG: peptidylprolyl isomerase [Clostridiales bacterium]|nr:peptidylprolyl isomerase [Clostridiales bacterium]
MFKRIVIGILTFVLAAVGLCGCSFFTHDTERDLQQKVAYVKPYTITNSVMDGEGDDQQIKVVEYNTTAKTVYKRDLVEYVNNNASNLSQSFGTAKAMYEYAVSMLLNVELVTNEVDALIDCGKVEWTQTETNSVKKSIYSIIDNTLTSIKNEILSARGQEEITTDTSDVSTDTTYPVKPDPDEDDDFSDIEDIPEVLPWEPSESKYPGIHGDDDLRSLEREAMRRFVALVEDRVKDDFRLDMPENKWLKDKINNEIKAIDRVINTEGIVAVYPKIGNYSYPMRDSGSEFGFIMYYISGESLERSQKITSLQAYLTEGVTVDDAEIERDFESKLNEQRSLYSSDISAYDSAMSDGSTTVLYHPNNNYFYVKHILLPFSDEQTAALTAYKKRPEVAGAQEDDQKELIAAYRARLAEAIVCYPHENGEDDLTRPMTVDQVMSHVKSVMRPLEANVARADVAFDDLVYLYNTDPGAFGNNQGYVVKYELDEGESETYMQEFADAARDMRDTISVGQVYGEPVITDYGVHIMYLASVTKVGAVSINDYTTPGRLETYYDVFEAPVRTARENNAYNIWERNVLSYNYNKYTETYTDNFSNLWED